MTLYAVWATDAPGTGEARLRVRDAHRARLRNPAPHAVTVLQGGPTLEGEGDAMNGSLLIVQAESLEAVRAFVAADPYVEAGVYERVEIRAWRCGLGSMAGV